MKTKTVQCNDGSYRKVTFRTAPRRTMTDVLWEGWDRLNESMDRMRQEHETAMGVLTTLFMGGLILLAAFIEGSDWPC